MGKDGLSVQDELSTIKASLDSTIDSNAKLDQSIAQRNQEIERAQQKHDEAMPLLKSRMERSQAQLQELNTKRAEDREEYHKGQAEREKYETELARLTRQYAAERHDLEQRMRTTVEKHDQYDREVKEVLDHHREDIIG